MNELRHPVANNKIIFDRTKLAAQVGEVAASQKILKSLQIEFAMKINLASVDSDTVKKRRENSICWRNVLTSFT